MQSEFKNYPKIGDTITAKIMGKDGEEEYVSGEIASINGDIVFIVSKYPRLKHYSIKTQNIIGGVNGKK